MIRAKNLAVRIYRLNLLTHKLNVEYIAPIPSEFYTYINGKLVAMIYLLCRGYRYRVR